MAYRPVAGLTMMSRQATLIDYLLVANVHSE
jgi:hypothetical protein